MRRMSPETGQHRRHPHAVLSSRFDHPSSDKLLRSSVELASALKQSGSVSASSTLRTYSKISIKRVVRQAASAGSGFAGAACRVTLVDRRNYHLFQPLLYEVATAALSPADIATPIRQLVSNCSRMSASC